ncbi:hypothetical protein [Roseateles terrae]|uniref:Uncharacterized protein n=1 Tax=Roseateles terrae TaxID=431060 RepID=A0ABR6H0F6_9BURK|nr:hypothetical protein [Roseateles terrae]MBB3197188.1 hypothetical protein [Roseateles terrae]
MNRVIPLQVPWMVAPSMPSLKLYSEEYGSTRVELFAFFGFVPENRDVSPVFAPSYDTDGVALDSKNLSGRYQLICLDFEKVGWVRRSPQHSDSDVVDESRFDWSCVKGRPEPNEQPADWHTRVMQDWSITRISPDPSVYIVENSDWNNEESKRFGLTHYLILGEYCYIEILAGAMEWSSKGSLNGW